MPILERDLIGMIYDAVADASRWPIFLEAFVHATNGKNCTLAIHTPEGWNLVRYYGWSDEDMRLYHERYAAIDPWGVADQVEEGAVLPSTDLCSQDEFEQSVAFREFYSPRGCDR